VDALPMLLTTDVKIVRVTNVKRSNMGLLKTTVICKLCLLSLRE